MAKLCSKKAREKVIVMDFSVLLCFVLVSSIVGTLGKCLKTISHGFTQAMWGKLGSQIGTWRNTRLSYSRAWISVKLQYDCSFNVVFTLR